MAADKSYDFTSFATQFTQREQDIIKQMGVLELGNGGILDKNSVKSLLSAIKKEKERRKIDISTPSGETLFKILVKRKIRITINLDRYNYLKESEVQAWLGEDLFQQFKQQIKQNNHSEHWGDFIQLLSFPVVRQSLAGDADTIRALQVCPRALKKLDGQDIRKLLREEDPLARKIFMEMTIEIFLGNCVKKSRPKWVDEGSFVLLMALTPFTDSQVAIIGKLLDARLRNPIMTICFLHTLLSQTYLDDQQLIGQCSDEFFTQLITCLQEDFIKVSFPVDRFHFFEQPAPVSHVDVITRKEYQDRFIRKYDDRYNSPHTLVPSDPQARMNALKVAFIKAASHGEFWHLLLLKNEISDINTQDLSTGRTALHEAVLYAERTGDKKCFDILISEPDIDPFVRDNEQQTPLDLCSLLLRSEKEELLGLSSVTEASSQAHHRLTL
jgi:hypothetical protein